VVIKINLEGKFPETNLEGKFPEINLQSQIILLLLVQKMKKIKLRQKN
jgi:hypothetical protein